MPKGRPGLQSGKKPMEVLKRMAAYILHYYKWACLLVVIMIFFSAIAMIYGNMFLQTLIDDYIVPLTGKSNPDFMPLLKAIFRIACVYVAGAACTYGYNRIMVAVTQGTLRHLRMDMFRHMETLPVRYFDTHTHGDIMSMYTNDTDTLRQMISQSFPQIVSSAITIVGVLISMIMLNIPLTILTLAMCGVMAKTAGFLGGKAGTYFVKQQKDLGAVNGYIEEMMSGQKVVKVFCHEEKNIEEFNRLNDSLADSADKANTFANILMPVNGNLGNISFVLCIVAGALMTISGFGGLTLGKLASFLQFNRSFSMPIVQVSQQFNAIIMALAGADRIFSLLDEKPEEDEGYVMLVRANVDAEGNITESEERTGTWAWKHYHKADNTTTYTRMEGDIVMEHVDFGYNPDKIVLKDISLYAKPGQKIAFVGATGAGKTTITNLINRFYDINSGKIRYDGININKFKKNDLRRSLGVVLQDTHLFTGTVMENIRYGRLDATDEQVKEAARLANAEYFIEHLPQGYDTMLTGDGANLSQGQRQLLAIARAAVADPPVLILDEATSSIDTRTEKIVQEGMDHLMEGRTVFVIAHRLSTIKNSDVIMVLDQGKIIERGDHDSLLKEKGIYYQLYTGMLEQD
ncbi:MAG: ABC transporter ATP-binding protein [Lachnospiraceae bacterium]|nr:ABC transporter ATP-binding protein [Lachnospiraceae bacterium]